MLSEYQKFFTARPTPQIAKDLLGRLLVFHGRKGDVGGWIVETEAYVGEQDSASHAFGGRRTDYSESLYGMPGNLYIYQIRSHYCVDIVVQDPEEPQGILIRALEPALGIEQMIENRGQDSFNLTNGPGKLMQALGVQSRSMDGQPMEHAALQVDLSTERRIPAKIIAGPRIGVNAQGKDALKDYRFIVAGNPYVSKMKRRDADDLTHGWR